MRKRYVFYTVWFFAVLAFFLYLLFPSDEIRKYIEYRVKNAGTAYTLHIGDVRPVLRPGLMFADTEVREGDTVVAEADEVRFMPRILSLFGSSRTADFQSLMYGGTVDGTVGVKKKPSGGEGEEFSADAVISGIRIRQIKALQNLPMGQISGILAGTVSYAGDNSGGKGEADLSVRDLTVELGTPVLSIGKLTFADVHAQLELESPQVLQIRECTVKGNQVGGNAAGTVGLRRPLEKSVLNLTGNIRPHASLIAQLGEGMTGILFKSNRGKSEIPFVIRGTLEKPEFSVQ